MPIDLDGAPAESLGAGSVGIAIPAEHRGAALAEAIHVEDSDQVVELIEAAANERLPDRAIRHLAVTAEHPHAIGQLVEILTGQRHAHADRQPLAQRAGGDVDPLQPRRRVTLEEAALL